MDEGMSKMIFYGVWFTSFVLIIAMSVVIDSYNQEDDYESTDDGSDDGGAVAGAAVGLVIALIVFIFSCAFFYFDRD